MLERRVELVVLVGVFLLPSLGAYGHRDEAPTDPGPRLGEMLFSGAITKIAASNDVWEAHRRDTPTLYPLNHAEAPTILRSLLARGLVETGFSKIDHPDDRDRIKSAVEAAEIVLLDYHRTDVKASLRLDRGYMSPLDNRILMEVFHATRLQDAGGVARLPEDDINETHILKKMGRLHVGKGPGGAGRLELITARGGVLLTGVGGGLLGGARRIKITGYGAPEDPFHVRFHDTPEKNIGAALQVEAQLARVLRYRPNPPDTRESRHGRVGPSERKPLVRIGQSYCYGSL